MVSSSRTFFYSSRIHTDLMLVPKTEFLLSFALRWLWRKSKFDKKTFVVGVVLIFLFSARLTRLHVYYRLGNKSRLSKCHSGMFKPIQCEAINRLADVNSAFIEIMQNKHFWQMCTHLILLKFHLNRIYLKMSNRCHICLKFTILNITLWQTILRNAH